MPWQIYVIMDTFKKANVPVIVSDNCLVSELMKKIKEHPHVPRGTNYRLHTSDGATVHDDTDYGDDRLSDYQIVNRSTVSLSVGLTGGVWPTLEKLERQPRNPRESERIQITTSSDHPDVCGLDDDKPRVIMPCGHAIAPLSLALHCFHELKNKMPEISCPGSNCNSTWPFSLIREAACLSINETVEFEQKLLTNRQNAEVKQCPNCLVSCHRKSDKGNRVGCLNCRSMGNKNYEFCWNCLHEWKHVGRYTCGNSDCGDNSGIFRILAKCGTIYLLEKQCPSLRACPNCSLIIEHTVGCKHMTCKRCQFEFCFMCLETHNWSSQSFDSCKVAPHQTSGVAFPNKPFQTPDITLSNVPPQNSAITLSNVPPQSPGITLSNVPSQNSAITLSNVPPQNSAITLSNVPPQSPGITFPNKPHQTSSDKRTSSESSCVIS